MARNSLITQTQWTLLCDKEQYIKFPAHDCDFSYIGETKRSFSIRKKEHLADIRHLRFDKSALTKHVFDNEHSMDWTNAKILDFELDFTKRRFIESYFINQIPNTMNDKQNDKFPSIYSATLLQTTWRNSIVFSRSANLSVFRFQFVIIFALTYDSLVT